eukprot:Hpha_TRINITY_DN7598_c0_g1::TRINITY_DN7598_c0_g1_i1::g.18930::m.18930
MSGFISVAQLSLAFLRGDDKGIARATQSLDKMFGTTPIPPTLVLNIISFNVMLVLFRHLACSPEFQVWAIYWSTLPSIVGSLGFYIYRYGFSATFLSLSPETLGRWVSNWCAMASIASYSFFLSAAYYGLVLVVEPFLPQVLQGVVHVPLSVIETSVMYCTYMLYGLGAVLLLTLPVWQHAYKVNTKMFGKNMQIPNSEMALELMYYTCQSTTAMQFSTGICLVQTQFLGLPFHTAHLVGEGICCALANYSLSLKFIWLHMLQHEIKPLYSMTHLEHHLPKSIFPTTSAYGVWEIFICGGSCFLSPALSSIPYLLFHLIYCGANIVVHTMFPFDWAAQWHTAHHILGADIYNANIPSGYDVAHSKSYAKHHEALEKISPFVRVGSFSDALGFALTILIGVGMHYGLGIGIFKSLAAIEIR